MRSCICTKIYSRRKTLETDVFEKLRELEEYVSVEKIFYVYYDQSTGKVIHFRNHVVDDTYPFLEVRESDIGDISDIDVRNFVVIEIANRKELVKRKSLEMIDAMSGIDDLVHRISKVNLSEKLEIPDQSHDYDLLIEQDLKEKVFRFRLSYQLKQQFNEPVFQEKTINLYLTNENDPNILHKSYAINLYNLSRYWYYTIPFDEDMRPNDFYTIRYFSKYLHMVINNG